MTNVRGAAGRPSRALVPAPAGALAAALLATLATLTTLATPATPAGAAPPAYRTPAPAITELLTAPAPPTPLLHPPSGRVALLQQEPPFPLPRLERPWLGLAGFRFDAATRTSGADPLVSEVLVLSASEPGATLGLWRPGDGARLADVRFSPDGRYLSAVVVGEGEPARLGVFDLEKGKERRPRVAIQAAWGSPCDWIAADALLCRVLPEEPGPVPAYRVEPDAIEHAGGPLPLRTYTNLLDDAHEEELFEYYFTSELARVVVGGGFSTRGEVARIEASRGLLSRVVPSPDGAFAVVSRVERPYSRMVRADRFPSAVEVWRIAGGRRVYASSAQGLGVREEINDPRHFTWLPGEPTQLGWLEPGPGGGAAWMALAAPFGGVEPTVVVRSPRRIRGFAWTTGGTPLFLSRAEDDDTEIFVVREGAAHLFWKGRSEDRYGDPGRAIRVAGSEGPILEHAGRVFLAGEGLGPTGPRPFLEAVDLATFETERLFTSAPGVFEQVVGVLDPTVPSFVTARETEVQAPMLFEIAGGERTLLRSLPDPYPALAAAERRRIAYRRGDGVELHASLYLPPGRALGERLPTFIYIYPREYTNRDYAEQIDVRHYRFHQVAGASPLAAVVAGYAVVTHPRMPIVGSGDDVNDAYLDQLAANAGALVEHLVDLGVTDPTRVAVGGHSYGAFSAANLLAHTRLFAAGIAISGAYNRTLTPFGFQSEKRSLWEAAGFYTRMSPFFYADRVRAPLLLMHGGSDPNPGTPPLQARRFFHALVGVGAQVRLVELPFEAHHLEARESILHASAEMLEWLGRTIGAGASEAQESPRRLAVD